MKLVSSTLVSATALVLALGFTAVQAEPQQNLEIKREPACHASGLISMYPTARMVRMNRGSLASSPNFLRSAAM